MSGRPSSSSGSTGGSVRFKKRKSRFSFPEVKLLLTEVRKNRHILVGKFNQGVSSDVKKQTWAALTARINEISECHREIIEIIKKWSDLKCDTKRKVAAMRAHGISAAQMARNLSPIETMVHEILQMSPSADKFSPNEDDVPDEDEDSQGALGVSQQSPTLANGRSSAQPVLPSLPLPLDMMYSNNSAVPLTDLAYESSGAEDQSLQSDRSATFYDPPTTDGELLLETETKHQAFYVNTAPSGISYQVAPPRPSPLPASVGPGSLQEQLARSASLSLKEQQATTALFGKLSRSLESLSESIQQLVQTQQQFARDTVRLQRDTLYVLRDFSSTTLALLQDKANGHP